MIIFNLLPLGFFAILFGNSLSAYHHKNILAFTHTPIPLKNHDVFRHTAVDTLSEFRPQFTNKDSVTHISTWYGATLLYNIYNKRALNMVKLPNTIAALQLSIGIPGILYNWLFDPKSRPKLNVKKSSSANKGFIQTFKNSPCVSILKQGAFNALSHGLSVYATSLGSPSMIHTIKALEPLFTSSLSYLFLGTKLPLGSYLSLVPIVAGVGLASYGGANVDQRAVYATLAANLFASLKNIEAKRFYTIDTWDKNLSPSNVHSLVTISSLLFLAPLALSEYPYMKPLFKMISRCNKTEFFNFLKYVTLSGIAYNIYNKVSYLTLSALGPISHAVANTFKRIFIISSSALIFDNKFTLNTAIGSGLAVLGTLGYSLAKYLKF